MPRPLRGRLEHFREKKKGKAQRVPAEAPAEHGETRRASEISGWGKCVALLLGAATLQAVVGIFMLQSRSEAVNPADLLVNNGGVAGPLCAFADPEAPFVVELNDEGQRRVLDPGDVAVLVVSSGRKVWLLRATLQSLSRVDGLRPANVLVSLGAPGGENQLDAIREFGFACAGFEGKGDPAKQYFPIYPQAAKGSAHMRRSLEFAGKHFGGKGFTFLVILEEGQIFSLDFLWFFVQLIPVFRRDESLICASAWNENGLAPYVADVTVLSRSDSFGGLAWMVELHWLEQLLHSWPKGEDWKDWLTQQMIAWKKQCVFPEVSRVALATADCLRPLARPGPDAAAQVEAVRRQNVPVTAGPSSKCPDEEIFSQRTSLRSVTSGQLRGFLGDVTARLQAQSFEEFFLWRWPGHQGMFYTQPVTSVSELDAHLGYEPAFLEEPKDNQVLARPPLRLVVESSRNGWAEVAKFFGFASDRPRGTYQGVLRFWWRNSVLYLVVDPTSPLLDITERHQRSWLGGGRGRSFLSPAQFKDYTNDPRRQHRPIPPGATISAAPLGESCLRHCEAQGQLCVDADLTAVAACAPPVTLSFGCRICEEEAVTSAFPGLHRDTGRCAAGQPAPGAPHAAVMAGDCAATAPRVRRFCVCRLPLVQGSGKAGHLRLRSPGRHFAHQEKTSHVDVASAESMEAFRASTMKARPSDYAKLNMFSEGLLPPGDWRLGPIGSIFVLFLGASSESLLTLKNVTGLVPNNVLVVGDAQANTAAGFRSGVGRSGAWRGEALKQGAALALEAKASSMLVLEEGQRLSPDLLVFLGQLEPLLRNGNSRGLWCVSAWNDNGLAPYAADATNVLRTDWFSGVAWMTSLEMLNSEILPKWKEEGWATHLRDIFRRKRQQCLIPEVSRAVPSEGDAQETTQASMVVRTPLCTAAGVDLGHVDRLQDVEYLRLFLYDWPMEEGLWKAKPLSSLKPLVDGRTNSDGPFSLIFRCSDVDKDVTWKALATFFGLWQEVPIRGSYEGVVRLRWRESILYLIATSSPLLRGEALGNVKGSELQKLGFKLKANIPIDPMLFYGLTPPFLRPPGGEVQKALWSGGDCHSTCKSYGQICVDQDLFFINYCAALGSHFSCRACEAAHVPALSAVAPAQLDAGDATGICVQDAAATHLPHCGARHENALRLCACRPLSLGLAGDEHPASPSAEDDATAVAGNFSVRKDGIEAADDLQLALRQELPSKLEAPILVIASAGRHRMLEQCLRSLAALPGYQREQILVSQDGADSRSQGVAEEMFKVAWVLHEQETLLDFDSRVTEHYGEAISYALYKRWPAARSLLVVEEDTEAAYDMLWYFAQLEPLLHEDPTLWCIGAWNDNGVAAFAADLSGLIRSDVFSGTLAWMLPAELYRKELLKRWPSKDWAQHFRSPVMAAGRQCLVPEVSRARHLGRDTRKDVAQAPTAAALQDARMLVSGSLVDFATKKRSVLLEAYHEDMRRALHSSSPIQDLSHLPTRLSGKQTERWQLLKGYRLLVESADRSSWEKLAKFFQLSPAYPPMGLYQNVMRLRWGAGAVLFLVLGSSELLQDTQLVAGTVAISAEAFRLAIPPQFVAPENVVAAGKKDMGRSCTSICESVEKVCYSADLLYLNSCQSLKQFHSCSRCEASHGSDQPAFWAPQLGNRNSGSCLYNSDVLLHPPSCDAEHPETQRLCACRHPLQAASVAEQPAQQAAPQPQSKVSTKKSLPSAEAAGWKPGLRAEAWHRGALQSFASQQDAVPQTLTALVLVLAVGDRSNALRETLKSLMALRNFDVQRLVISLGCCGAEVEQTKRMLEIDFPKLQQLEEAPTMANSLRGRSRLLADSVRDTEHLGHAITKALERSNASSLLVVHEGTLLSPDALPFFSQLEPLMTEDPTIWCIGAWNRAGLAPYASDLTALLRSDWHPTSYAWLMRRETLQELLRQWPGSEWERFIHHDQIRLGRQCILPEVSRCHPTGPPANMDEPALRRSERSAYDEFHRTVFWNKDVDSVHLGDLRRMLEGSYEKLILEDWPRDEALVKSSRATPRELAEATSGNHHVVLEDRQGSWTKAMSFFRLPWSKEIRLPSSYKGYLRLRWRSGVVHLLQWNSPLLASAEIPKQTPKKGQDFLVPPVLRAPDVSVVVSGLAESCDQSCARFRQGRCHDEDLLFLNGCSAIRSILGVDACGECLASDGQDFPAVVLLDADASVAAEDSQYEMDFKGKFSLEEHSPSLGSCLYSVNLAKAPSCKASHQRLARLCPCRPLLAAQSSPAALSVPSDRAILRDLVPLGQLDATLPSQRCGAMFGNRLANDCAAAGLWCCSAGMWCGSSSLHCKSPDHECRGGASPFSFCGAGWTLRLAALQLPNLAG